MSTHDAFNADANKLIAAQNLQSSSLDHLQSISTTLTDVFQTLTVVTVVFFLVFFVYQLAMNIKVSRDTYERGHEARAKTAELQKSLREKHEALTAQITQTRGDFAGWLTDEAFALRLFIWEADRSVLPHTVTNISDAEAVFQDIESLKCTNAEAVLSLVPFDADADAAARLILLEVDLLRVQNTWQAIRVVCDKLNERTSLSPIITTGYRVTPENLPEISHS